MKKIFLFIAIALLKLTLPLRYRIKIKGLESIQENKSILFLSTHPAEIDSVILMTLLWRKFKPRPLALDVFFQDSFLAYLFSLVKALPVPDFSIASNSFKLKRIEGVFNELNKKIKEGDNFLIYPAGGLKRSGEEVIGGSSGVHRLVQQAEGAKIVLIRIQGLWGSSFSYAITGKMPDILRTFLFGLKVLLKNLIFFTPRRDVEIEFKIPPHDFPFHGTRLEFNRALESSFNEKGREPLNLVSYSCWKNELLTPVKREEKVKTPLKQIPLEVKEVVFQELSRLSKKSEIKENDDLSIDLGLDSLDQAQLIVFLKENFGVQGIQSGDLDTAGDLLELASGFKKGRAEEENSLQVTKRWEEEINRLPPEPPSGKTLIESFLKNSKRMEDHCACADALSGELTYKKMRLAIILLAKKIKEIPGERIAIMMPASTAVNLVILATQLAGKIPVMINWTLGPRNLEAILNSSGIQKTISSWRFLNRLENFDLDGFDENFILVEEIKRSITLKEKLQGLLLSKKNPETILRSFDADKIDENHHAVILYTSGTESFPKAVPLTHLNILSNQRDAFKMVPFTSGHTFLGALPPFHSFGFSVTGLFPLLTGLRVAYSPNPTDGRRLGAAIEKWQVTVLCLAPTFLKNLLRVASKEQLKSLKLVIAGAEKTYLEIYEKMREVNPEAILTEGYGITECAPILTLNPPFGKKKGVGLPFASCELMVVHPENMEPLPCNHEGVILARGPNLFPGYLDSNVASPFVSVAEKRWYFTGDIGSLDDEGYLTLSGRLKRFVKIGGEMVSLGAIEEILVEEGKKASWNLSHDLPSLAVAAKEDPGKKTALALFTTFPLSLEEANLVLKKEGMSNLIRLAQVKQIPFIPLLGTGKIDYRTLNSKW